MIIFLIVAVFLLMFIFDMKFSEAFGVVLGWCIMALGIILVGWLSLYVLGLAFMGMLMLLGS